MANLGHGFSPPKKVMHGVNTTNYTNEKGQTFYDRWQENHGKVKLNGRTLKQAVRKLIRSAAYRRLPEESFQGLKSPRIGEIQKLISKYRERAWGQTLKEFPEVRKLDKKNSRIKANRKAGRSVRHLLDY